MAAKRTKKTTPKKPSPKKTGSGKNPPAKTPARSKPATKAAPAKTTAKKAVAKTRSGPVEPPVTTIVARIDAGFGNSLFIRGVGADLDWDEGVHMECVATDEWRFTTSAAAEQLEVKLLLNDDRWSTGDNLVVKAGEELVVAPSF
jgi:hypothetical protein